MAVVVTKFKIRSTCAVRVTQARHPVVHVCLQVSHKQISKLFYFKKDLRKWRKKEEFVSLFCVCQSIDCVRRLLCLVGRLHVRAWNFLTFCRDANAFVLNPGTAGIDYFGRNPQNKKFLFLISLFSTRIFYFSVILKTKPFGIFWMLLLSCGFFPYP